MEGEIKVDDVVEASLEIENLDWDVGSNFVDSSESVGGFDKLCSGESLSTSWKKA